MSEVKWPVVPFLCKTRGGADVLIVTRYRSGALIGVLVNRLPGNAIAVWDTSGIILSGAHTLNIDPATAVRLVPERK